MPSNATLQSLRLAAAAIAFAALPAVAQEAPAQDAQAAPAMSPDKVVATVEGRPITEGELVLAAPPQRPGQPPQTDEQRRASALSALIDLRAVAARAEEEGLVDEDFERRMQFLRDRELHNAYLSSTIEPAITEALLRERYDQEVGSTPPVDEIRASHILLETEEDAKAVIAELEAGADFAELARARSTGPSAANGGDLGFFGPGRMVPAFDEAARALDVGASSSEPVQTQFGFHVIKVTDKREVAPPPFEQVREQVREIVARELYVEALREARADAEVQIEDAALARLIPGAQGGTSEEAEPAAGGESAPAATASDDAEADLDEASQDEATDGATTQ